MIIDREKIKQLPKGDVHNHLTLGVSRETLKNYYKNISVNFPEFYDGLEGMIDFIHSELTPIMCTGDDVIKFMELAIEDSIDDNVTYLEASVDMNLVKYFENNVNELIDVVSGLKEKYRKKIEFLPEIGMNKDIDKRVTYKNIIACIESEEFFGIDLYGPEKDMKLDGFVELFKVAGKMELKTKVHIGEFSNSKTIDDAIDLLNPDEIQHGINAVHSEKTIEKILERGIQLNICPQSNIALGSVRSMNEHPIRKLYDYGIKITINTDDLLIFDATISDQYISLIESGVFSYSEIDELRKNSLNTQ